MANLTINGTAQRVDLPDEVPLLWALRDGLNMTGTKFGCGVAACADDTSRPRPAAIAATPEMKRFDAPITHSPCELVC